MGLARFLDLQYFGYCKALSGRPPCGFGTYWLVHVNKNLSYVNNAFGRNFNTTKKDGWYHMSHRRGRIISGGTDDDMKTRNSVSLGQ